MKPKFIFPSNISDPSIPDPAWENEFKIASEKTDCYLINLEPLNLS